MKEPGDESSSHRQICTLAKFCAFSMAMALNLRDMLRAQVPSSRSWPSHLAVHQIDDAQHPGP